MKNVVKLTLVLLAIPALYGLLIVLALNGVSPYKTATVAAVGITGYLAFIFVRSFIKRATARPRTEWTPETQKRIDERRKNIGKAFTKSGNGAD